MSADPMVRIERVSRVFDVSRPLLARVLERRAREYVIAVADVSFSIDERETFGLVGESGSGKSTLAKIVVGLLPPSTGSVHIDGLPVHRPTAAQARDLRHRIQMIFQDPYASLDPRWRVADIVAEPIRALGLAETRGEVAGQVEDLLRRVGLDPRDGGKYPHEFSGGQRQRIAIARALSSRPRFIACDEPTSALDVSVQAQILNLMRDLQEQFGLTFLLISHNLAVVRHMATRIGVMYLGRLVEVAPSRRLFATPQHPYTRMLLEAVPDLAMVGRTRKAIEGEIPSPIRPPSGCPFHPRCPFAFERCPVERPALLPAQESLVACHAVEEGRL